MGNQTGLKFRLANFYIPLSIFAFLLFALQQCTKSEFIPPTRDVELHGFYGMFSMDWFQAIILHSGYLVCPAVCPEIAAPPTPPHHIAIKLGYL